MLHQLGCNLAAISGGRYEVVSDTAVRLPVSNIYAVEITYLEAWDLYEVRRVRTTKGDDAVTGTLSMLYFDQMPEAAYRASCYVSDPFP